jgi:predicted amidohydrolase YtcJ
MNKVIRNLAIFFVFISAQAFASASTVYFNGDILTMEGDKPQYVEAVVVKDGKIAFAGNMQDAMNQAGANPSLQDLKGKTLLPSFIDAWGHFTLIAQTLEWLDCWLRICGCLS